MSPVNVEERLRPLREQALGRDVQPDAWPRLQRRLRLEAGGSQRACDTGALERLRIAPPVGLA